jgi:hypothetical protein
MTHVVRRNYPWAPIDSTQQDGVAVALPLREKPPRGWQPEHSGRQPEPSTRMLCH